MELAQVVSKIFYVLQTTLNSTKKNIQPDFKIRTRKPVFNEDLGHIWLLLRSAVGMTHVFGKHKALGLSLRHWKYIFMIGTGSMETAPHPFRQGAEKSTRPTHLILIRNKKMYTFFWSRMYILSCIAIKQSSESTEYYTQLHDPKSIQTFQKYTYVSNRLSGRIFLQIGSI